MKSEKVKKNANYKNIFCLEICFVIIDKIIKNLNWMFFIYKFNVI